MKTYPKPPGGNFQTPPFAIAQSYPKKKQDSLCFISTVMIVLVFQYVCYTGIILPPLLYPQLTVIGAILTGIFNFLFIMVVSSYAKCVTTDPGSIPRHWAFHKGDVAKRRRYCKECNAWKPDRTHHCSSCARCILNMDHHCPWVNNCVGFYNRKFFMQLLIYGVLGLGLVFLHSLLHITVTLWMHFFSIPGSYHVIDLILLALATLLTGVSGFLFLAMTQFTKFHMRLVATNLTTIENLDSSARENGKYDLGISRNCKQVFGPNVLLWWMPHHTTFSSPVGDGVRWTTPTDANQV